MPNPHFDISITQRSKNQSAVAGAAYQSGESLFSEYDQKRKNYTSKGGIVYTEIMLPENAPPEFSDRETLWNSVEEVEKQWNSQLARRFVLALPREVPMEMYPQMIRDYCQKYFVKQGMCCDFAIHDPDPPGHNPHCHIMLTLRAMDEHGKWLPKSRKVYDLDENGERIRLPSGRWKSHKENTVDWNEQWHCEQWRRAWEDIQNRYLAMAGSQERVDLRSYARQGIDLVPTVHLGPAVTQMERRGIKTNIGNLNRDIRAANSLMRVIRKTISSLRDWINDLRQSRTEEIIRLRKEQTSPSLAGLLQKYMDLRKAERSDWSRYGQQKGSNADLKAVAEATAYLQSRSISTLDQLDNALQNLNGKAQNLRSQMKESENRMKMITGIQKAVSECRTYKDVHDKYVKIGWKLPKQMYADKHKDELAAFNKSFRYLKKQGVDLKVNLNVLQAEYDRLKEIYADQTEQLSSIRAELQPLKDVRYWIDKVLAEDPIEKKEEPRHSITERLEEKKEQQRQEELPKKPKKKRQHDMEL